MQPNFMFCWPHARIGIASTEDLLDEMGKDQNSTEKEKFMKVESEHPGSAMIHDGTILPSETRRVRTKSCVQDK